VNEGMKMKGLWVILGFPYIIWNSIITMELFLSLETLEKMNSSSSSFSSHSKKRPREIPMKFFPPCMIAFFDCVREDASPEFVVEYLMKSLFQGQTLYGDHHLVAPMLIALRLWWCRVVEAFQHLPKDYGELDNHFTFVEMDRKEKYPWDTVLWFRRDKHSVCIQLFEDHYRRSNPSDYFPHFSPSNNINLATLEKVRQQYQRSFLYDCLGSNNGTGSVVTLHPYLTDIIGDYSDDITGVLHTLNLRQEYNIFECCCGDEDISTPSTSDSDEY
jgi:hypothetical protein